MEKAFQFAVGEVNQQDPEFELVDAYSP